MQIGATAGNEDRRHVFMQRYDEVVRKDWAEKARRGDDGFDVNVSSCSLDLEALNSARHLYDTLYPKQAKGVKGGGKSSSKSSNGMLLSAFVQYLGAMRVALLSTGKGSGVGKGKGKRTWDSEPKRQGQWQQPAKFQKKYW